MEDFKTKAVLAVMAALSWSAAFAEPFDRVTAAVAAGRVERCGLGPVTRRYDDLLQSDILTAASATSVTDAQLACADAAASFYQLELPARLQPRYDAIREARLTAIVGEESRAWLAARGLLDRLPPYQRGTTDEAAFVLQVEQLCGPEAEGAFGSAYGMHAIDPEWARGRPAARNGADEALACLLHATSAAGYPVGIIGAEAAAAPH